MVCCTSEWFFNHLSDYSDILAFEFSHIFYDPFSIGLAYSDPLYTISNINTVGNADENEHDNDDDGDDDYDSDDDDGIVWKTTEIVNLETVNTEEQLTTTITKQHDTKDNMQNDRTDIPFNA